MPGKDVLDYPKVLLFTRHPAEVCDRRIDGGILCQPELASHPTPQICHWPLGQKTLQEEALQDKDLSPQPGLPDLHRPALKSTLREHTKLTGQRGEYTLHTKIRLSRDAACWSPMLAPRD